MDPKIDDQLTGKGEFYIVPIPSIIETIAKSLGYDDTSITLDYQDSNLFYSTSTIPESSYPVNLVYEAPKNTFKNDVNDISDSVFYDLSKEKYDDNKFVIQSKHKMPKDLDISTTLNNNGPYFKPNSYSDTYSKKKPLFGSELLKKMEEGSLKTYQDSLDKDQSNPLENRIIEPYSRMLAEFTDAVNTTDANLAFKIADEYKDLGLEYNVITLGQHEKKKEKEKNRPILFDTPLKKLNEFNDRLGYNGVQFDYKYSDRNSNNIEKTLLRSDKVDIPIINKSFAGGTLIYQQK